MLASIAKTLGKVKETWRFLLIVFGRLNFDIFKSAFCNLYRDCFRTICFSFRMFTNIPKQQNMLKITLLFRKFTNFTGKQLENSQDQECEVFRVLFLYEHKNIERFSNLHNCTFKECFYSLNILINIVLIKNVCT